MTIKTPQSYILWALTIRSVCTKISMPTGYIFQTDRKSEKLSQVCLQFTCHLQIMVEHFGFWLLFVNIELLVPRKRTRERTRMNPASVCGVSISSSMLVGGHGVLGHLLTADSAGSDTYPARGVLWRLEYTLLCEPFLAEAWGAKERVSPNALLQLSTFNKVCPNFISKIEIISIWIFLKKMSNSSRCSGTRKCAMEPFHLQTCDCCCLTSFLRINKN